jgi:hypothetical protein
MVLLMAEKEGLQSAIDFTKLLLTLAGGAIAFVIQPSFIAGSIVLKVLSISALLSLSISVLSGLVSISGSCVMLSEKNYRLEYRFVKYPGIINVITFAIGFVLVAVAVGVKIVGGPPSFYE